MTGGRKLTAHRARVKEQSKVNLKLNAINPLFTKLSGEMRNAIWAMVVGEDEEHKAIEGVNGGWTVVSERYQGTRFPMPPILHVCKQIRDEATYILYGRNKFIIDLVDPIDYFKSHSKADLTGNATKAPPYQQQPLRGFPGTILQRLRCANITSTLLRKWEASCGMNPHRAGFVEVVIRHDEVAFFGGYWPSGFMSRPAAMPPAGTPPRFTNRYRFPETVYEAGTKDTSPWYVWSMRRAMMKKMAKREIDWSRQLSVASEQRIYRFEVEIEWQKTS